MKQKDPEEFTWQLSRWKKLPQPQALVAAERFMEAMERALKAGESWNKILPMRLKSAITVAKEKA